MNKLDIESEIRNLSSSTISTITGLKEYNDIEQFINVFVDYAINSCILFKNWQEAFVSMANDFSFNLKKGKADISEIKKYLC